MENTIILTPEDNTKMDGFVDETYSKGYSEYNRLYIPNQGTAENGDILHYFPYGSITLGPKVAINKKQIFLKNGYLVKPGVIVEKYYVKKSKNGLVLGDEQYFKVIDSSIDTVPKNSLIIVMAGQGYRFNLNKRSFFFIQPDKILLTMNASGINAGPSNLLLKTIKPIMLGVECKNPNKGELGGKTYYFEEALYEVVIANVRHYIVAKSDIKIIS